MTALTNSSTSINLNRPYCAGHCAHGKMAIQAGPGLLFGRSCKRMDRTPGFRMTFDGSVTSILFTTFAKEQAENIGIYALILDWFREAFPSVDRDCDKFMRDLFVSVADVEIDLLVESQDYCMFIEAKLRHKPARFSRTSIKYGSIHQLVRQLVQGTLLSRRIGKEFMMATLGASDEGITTVELNDYERRMLSLLLGKDRAEIPIRDFQWELFDNVPAEKD